MSDRAAIGRVAVVGARGQMGRLFTQRCARAGVEAACLGRPLSAGSVREAVRGADLLLLSVPATALEDVLSLVVPQLRESQILADNVSVKVMPMQAMCAHYQGPVVGTHPLFGPQPPPDMQRVAITPGPREQDGAAAEAVAELHRRLGFDPFFTTPQEHDRAAALIQGLNFVTTVSYLATLGHEPDILPYLTPSFIRRLDAAKKMLTEDADLFATMFEANPYGQDAVRRFRNFLHVAAGGDMDLLVQRALWWWEERADGKPGMPGLGTSADRSDEGP